MNLDSDLGIDSIKRVEILSALQERFPDAPAVTPDQVGSLGTLRQIADHLAGGLPAAPVHAASPPCRTGPDEHIPPRQAAGAGLEEALLDVVAQKTGYPVDMLNLEMNLDSDLGIDSIKRVEIWTPSGRSPTTWPAGSRPPHQLHLRQPFPRERRRTPDSTALSFPPPNSLPIEGPSPYPGNPGSGSPATIRPLPLRLPGSFRPSVSMSRWFPATDGRNWSAPRNSGALSLSHPRQPATGS
jgi:acyl carrier protein